MTGSFSQSSISHQELMSTANFAVAVYKFLFSSNEPLLLADIFDVHMTSLSPIVQLQLTLWYCVQIDVSATYRGSCMSLLEPVIGGHTL